MICSSALPEIGGLVAGKWLTRARAGKTFPVINPATGETLADVPDMGADETRAAIDAAAEAMSRPPASSEARAKWLARIADLLVETKNDLAGVITQEQGKPLKESAGEVDYAAGFFRFFSKQLHHLAPHALDQTIRDCRWTIHHRPAGVAALITPWNFPLAMLAKKLSAALGAGCAVVIKPADLTPLSAMALVHVCVRAGVPVGVVNLIVAKDPEPISQVFFDHPGVRVISFTGSTRVGKLLIEGAAAKVKRLCLELGGNAPFIVFDDADVAAAADGLIASKFRAAGQTCVCANRVYIHRAVERAFVEAVGERVKKLKVGNGMEDGVEIGPLINRAGFEKVSRHVRDAVERGAKLVVGDDRPRQARDYGNFYPPTVLTGVTAEMVVCQEETFGPVVAIGTFDDESRVIDAANATEYGLAAYVHTRDIARTQRILPRLKFGHVAVNSGTGPTPEAPFGGMKQSGFGREGGVEGLFDFCETQTTAVR
ncbi:MAG: NAD-dependent succinate-semialdehyde dehydrogenase [Tepidisphaeraceae bacterium]